MCGCVGVIARNNKNRNVLLENREGENGPLLIQMFFFFEVCLLPSRQLFEFLTAHAKYLLKLFIVHQVLLSSYVQEEGKKERRKS